ncbi:unnamed protein product [Acanthoscelides obtectus]|uniref:Tesmin/TSO1-like CXC domain-containing protein n=1 Tax=Acanthoscelides obtectus TaxID=200917 RepID=A0A9P0M607_ACAOB|nr:unnamed protein product [Acanthoscelides obtectus]CAK1663640.1 hypothetical protein AOBTE_LOCUS23763 [Acanthoscelides obtectus]
MQQNSNCAICSYPLARGNCRIVGKKGISTLITQSKRVEDKKCLDWEKKEKLDCHEKCRLSYSVSGTYTQHFALNAPNNNVVAARDEVPDFHYADNCFICGLSIIKDAKTKICTVTQKETRDNLIAMGKERNDSLGISVVERLENISCLIRVQGRYHRTCMSQFNTYGLKKNIDDLNWSRIDSLLEPVWQVLEEDKNVIHYLSKLVELVDDDSIDRRTVADHIKKRYGEEVECSKMGGKDIRASNIMHREIRSKQFVSDKYPPSNQFVSDLSSDYPPHFSFFIEHFLLIADEEEDKRAKSVKRYDISMHTFIHSATYVFVHPPLLDWDIDSEKNRFQASTIVNPPRLIIEKPFVQFVFDNTDHNVRTLDGRETFHCLGGIQVYTPEHEITQCGSVEKLTEMPSANILAKQEQIPIFPYVEPPKEGLKLIEFIDTNLLTMVDMPLFPPTYSTYLWAKYVDPENVPAWRGFMEICSENESFQRSGVQCQQFINEVPSSLTTIYTSIMHAKSETRKCGQKTTILTYDLPLYMKCRDIIAKLMLPDVFVRLGGFHMLMSFLGAIGIIMGGSGLESMWELAYASESIKKMMDGHNYSRAVRAHILTFTALGIVICDSIEEKGEIKGVIASLMRVWQKNPLKLGDSDSDKDLKKMSDLFYTKLKQLKNNGPTAKLWVQYIEAVLIVLRFIEAERLGNWDLHLDCVRRMLPLFHAAGHFQYAKAAQIYLQDMVLLQDIMDPQEFHQFATQGYFTIHRSDKAWSGIWSDMTIEQTLNRFFGTDLTHGRGVTRSVVSRYLLGMPCAVHVMQALEEYCNLETRNSEQHVDLGKGRKAWDAKDIASFVTWLKGHEPFKVREELISLSTGVVGGVEINCHMAFERGTQAMCHIVGRTYEKVSLSKLYKIKNLDFARTQSQKAMSSTVTVDTSLLFQRLSVAMRGRKELSKSCFDYEMSPVPLSLFDEKGSMRKTDKSQLYKMFTTTLSSRAFFDDSQFVVDGGWLLHSLVWPHSKTYRAIFDMYKNFLVQRFGRSVIIVFDGYEDEHIGVKSYERDRRQERNCGVDVEIEPDNLVPLNQRTFLSNVKNKAQFVYHLGQTLATYEGFSFTVIHAKEDADVEIVRTALKTHNELFRHGKSQVIVVGSDVDLLILLIGLTPTSESMYYYKMGQGGKANQLYDTRDHKHLQPFLLFAHAFAGCDTTSCFFGKGKMKLVKLLLQNDSIRALALKFYEPDCLEDELLQCAETITLALYKDKEQSSSLGTFRYNLFSTNLAKAKKETPLECLPPTSPALLQHCKRVYYQIQVWLQHRLDPCLWGWTRQGNILIPIMSEADPAPKELLQKVSCGCQGPCKSKRCNCRKAGLKCNPACKVCRGKSCNNSKRWTATEHHNSETPTTTDSCEEDGGQTTVEPDNDDLTEDDETSSSSHDATTDDEEINEGL